MSVFLKKHELFATLFNFLLISEFKFYFADTNLNDTFCGVIYH